MGTVIGGKYHLLSVLGTGGMGAVYRAENTWTRREVALKLLHPELTNSREVVERFMQEAQLASQLRHPNIVDVLDMGQEPSDGSFFIVQELLHGNDLRTVIDASGRLDAETSIDIVLPLMGALALAHRRGVVHRDIKPENIFLAQDESGETVPKLIDFGISKIMTASRDARNLTQTGTLVGTPNYMSPEQARGDVLVDGQTDVWSLGVVLYEILSGRVPFDAPNQNMLMVKIITEHAQRIETVAPDLPASLAELVHRALAHDRAARFADMPVFIAAVLQSGLGGLELFERHRRSLSVSAELTGHFLALARSRGSNAASARVTPAGSPVQLAPSQPSRSSENEPTVPRLAALDTIDEEAPTSVSRSADHVPVPVIRAAPGVASQLPDAPTMPRIAAPQGSIPSATPVGWEQDAGSSIASAPIGPSRWVVVLAGVTALLLAVVAGVFWTRRHDSIVVSQSSPSIAHSASTVTAATTQGPTRVTAEPSAVPEAPVVPRVGPDAAVDASRQAAPPRAEAPVRRVLGSPPFRPAPQRPQTPRPLRDTQQNGAPILGL
ncbi:MAG: protein kinase [Polyangiales bacterium]